MATRLLTGRDGQVAGAIAVNTRTSEFLVVKAKAVILCMGAAAGSAADLGLHVRHL